MNDSPDQPAPRVNSRTEGSPADGSSVPPPTADSSHTTASSPDTITQRAGSKRPADFGDLATRLRGRAVDLLAIGLLAAVIVGFGRQSIRWWNADPETTTVPSPLAEPVFPLFGGDGQPVTVEFGRRRMSLARRAYSGSRSSAVEQLATLCLERTLKAPLPAGPPDSAEQRMLTLLASRKPWDALPGQWRVFLTEGPVSLAVGLRHVQESIAGNAEGSGTAQATAPAGRWRVVATAMAFPAGDGNWTIYETTPPGAAAGGNTTRQPVPPAVGELRDRLLPAAAELLLSLTDAGGSSVTSFRIPAATPGDLPQLQVLFDTAARQAAGKVLHGWQRGATAGATATSRASIPGTVTAAWQVPARGTLCRWEIRLTADATQTGYTGWASLLLPGSGEQPARPADR